MATTAHNNQDAYSDTNTNPISTDRHYQEQQMQYYASLAQCISDAIISTDMNFNIVSWNDAAEALYGWRREEVVGKPVQHIISTDYLSNLEEAPEEVLLARGYWKGEVIQRRKDGTPLHILASVSMVKDNTGKIIGAVSVNRDISERKQMEDTLRLSEIRYRMLIEQSPLSIQILAPNGRTLQVNSAWEELWGVTLDQIAGYNMLEDQQLVEKGVMPYIQKAFAGQATEIPAIKYEPDKTIEIPGAVPYRWVRAFIYPVKDEFGNIREVVLIHEDITESRQAEEMVQRSEKRFRALIENSTDAVALLDTSGTILYASPSTKRILGYESEEFVGRNAFELMHPDDQGKTAMLLAELLQGAGSSRSAEFRFRHKNGTWRWLEGTGTNLLYEPGVQAIVGNFRDITERHQAEEEREQLLAQLAIEHARLEEVLRQMPAGVIIAEAPSGKIIMGNRQVQEIWRHSVLPSSNIEEYGEWKGFHPDSSIVKPEEWPLARAITKGEVVQGEEIEYLRGDGTRGFMRISAAPIRDRSGKIVAGVVTFDDFTDYKELEKRKDDFISMASHELKTPITSIKALTQILKRSFEKQGMTQPALYLSKMEVQIDKLTKLIGDLLDISKIQAGQLEFDEEAFDFDELVRETVENVQQTSKTHTILVSGALHREIVGDKDHIGQVLVNLLTNAIKYSPEADRVNVRIRADEQDIIVSVQDYGVGIAQEHRDKIFERFYRVYDERDKTFPGLGIGLYISYQIVKRHGGNLWVESREGEGSTFYFSLPLTR